MHQLPQICVDVDEAARIVSVTTFRVRSLVDDGTLLARMDEGRALISYPSLIGWYDSLPAARVSVDVTA